MTALLATVRIYRLGGDELALHHIHSLCVVIDHDGINLLVVGSIGDAIVRLADILSMNIVQIPSHETLAIVWKMLLIIVLRDVLCDLFEHNPSSLNQEQVSDVEEEVLA
ncbi:MAG: hypothetical protein FWG56_04930 [Desulfovibrionaceae bacterium]|jgi:hypothetical protein|nr:hypothetical protein [Desulfovibrionaceae bacterium]